MGGVNASMPHFVLVPLMAPGHMIPMVDLGRLLASRGASVSLITTPANAARIKPLIDDAEAAGLPIRFVVFDFPCAAAGVPEGCENFDSLPPNKNLAQPFFTAISLLRAPLETYLREVHPRPSCIITDFCNWWTSEAARELRLPRFIFHGPSCFFILSSRNIHRHKAYDAAKDEFDPVVVPGLPQKIEISRAQSPGWFPGWEEMEERVFKAEETATGIVINTFRELEADYIELYAKATEKIPCSDTTCLNLTETETGSNPTEITNHQKMVLSVGPFSLYNKDATSKATRGNASSVDGDEISRWLDGMEPRSVLFVSFGSVVRAKPLQLIEIGHGLESSNRPFVWVIKKAERCPEVERWLSEGFEERTRARGVVITGWAPQMVILSHPAVGGFVTHCGWNSILESVSSGVPMITWPFFVDQFLNEKLVVEVLRIGVPIGVQIPYYYFKEEEVAVGRDAVEKAIVSLMDGGEEGEERRVRAREFGEKAGKAMAEGGSSYENLTLLIQFVVEHCKQNDMQQEELQL